MHLHGRGNNGEYVPIANRRETIFGVVITFQILSTIAVALRAYVRAVDVRKLGADDVLIFLAWATVMVGSTFICLSVPAGLGQHFAAVAEAGLIETYLFNFYISYVMYSFSATLVKLSLLCQYLRVIKNGIWRWACIGLMVVSGMWGFAYTFMAAFPCFPVKAYWDWSITTATCYGYGVRAEHPFVEMFVSHTAINVLLDVAIVLVPVPFLLRRAMTKREKWSIFGLGCFGLVIIWLCVWRLVTIVNHSAGWEPTMDFSWRSPISIILGCLEAQIAIVAVSIPIFWSVIEEQILQIFVQNEIEITEISHPLELVDHDHSAKSDAGSEEGFAPSKRWTPPRTLDQKELFYREVIERVSPNPNKYHSTIEAPGDGGNVTRFTSR